MSLLEKPFSPEFKISYTIEEIEQVNWNEEWEKNFEPIDVDGRMPCESTISSKN
jgi:hypothetical protein